MDVKPPNHHELGILVLLKRRQSLRFGMIQMLVGKYGKSNDPSYVANSLRYLLDWDFATKEGSVYTISSKGREYLSMLRNYLRNYRL
jgi:hypothetical protein